MKTNYTNHTATGTVSFTFAQMAVLESLLQLAAMEAVDGGDAQSTVIVCEIAEELGIDIEVDEIVPVNAGNVDGLPGGLPTPAGSASEETDLEVE